MPTNHRLTDEERAARLEAARNEMEAAVAGIVTGEDWQAWLKLQSQLHHYSSNNCMWLLRQSIVRGEPIEAVAGYRTWQSMGRQVRKGEKGWQVLAPVTRRMEPGEEQQPPEKKEGEPAQRRIVGFRVETVFDLSQTDGEPLPPSPASRCARLDGSVDPALIEAIEAVLRDAGCRVERIDAAARGWSDTQNGSTDVLTREVSIRAGMSPAQTAKTLAHELAHVTMRHTGSDRRAEVEAESVAYLVLDGVGVDSANYSYGYVASWSGGDMEVVQASARAITVTATELSARIDLELDRLQGVEDEAVQEEEDSEDEDVLVMSL